MLFILMMMIYNLIYDLIAFFTFTLWVFLVFQQDLIDDLKYELTGKFERLIVSLMRTPAYHDAKEIHDAIKVRPSLLEVFDDFTAYLN